MTVKDALQRASIRLIGQKIDTFFSSPSVFELEVTDLLNEVAEDLRKVHDWQFLTKLATITGDGATEGHSMPTDYDRMGFDAKVWDASWPTLHFLKAGSADAYYLEKTVTTAGAPGWWIVLGNKLNIWPILGDQRQAQFYYITKNVGTANGSNDITKFSSDDDISLFDERLLTLGVIWKHKSQKGLEYAEDLANYNKALSEAIRDDKSATVIKVRSRRSRQSVGLAYPGAIIE